MARNRYLQTKIEERSAKSSTLQALQDIAAREGRDLTDAEKKTFEEIVARLKDLDADIQRIKDFDEAASKFVDLVAQAESEEAADRAYAGASGRGDGDGGETRAARDFGKQFVESTAFKAYRGSGRSEALRLPGPASPEFRAAIDTGFFPDFTKQMVWGGPAGPTTTTPLLDAVGRVATSNGSVVYLKWGPVPPAEAAVVAESALKPEANITLTEVPLALETVAHWKVVTKQALEDIPQIQSLISNRLLTGVRLKLESMAAAVIAGATLPTAEGADLLSAIRVGIATAESKGYSVNGVLVNPADAADLDLAAMGASFSGPVRSGTAWGVPILPSPKIAAGSAYVGDLKQGVTWFDRGTTDVFMSDSHADLFLRNQLVILAEARAAFAVPEPDALVKVTATDTP